MKRKSVSKKAILEAIDQEVLNEGPLDSIRSAAAGVKGMFQNMGANYRLGNIGHQMDDFADKAEGEWDRHYKKAQKQVEKMKSSKNREISKVGDVVGRQIDSADDQIDSAMSFVRNNVSRTMANISGEGSADEMERGLPPAGTEFRAWLEKEGAERDWQTAKEPRKKVIYQTFKEEQKEERIKQGYDIILQNSVLDNYLKSVGVDPKRFLKLSASNMDDIFKSLFKSPQALGEIMKLFVSLRDNPKAQKELKTTLDRVGVEVPEEVSTPQEKDPTDQSADFVSKQFKKLSRGPQQQKTQQEKERDLLKRGPMDKPAYPDPVSMSPTSKQAAKKSGKAYPGVVPQQMQRSYAAPVTPGFPGGQQMQDPAAPIPLTRRKESPPVPDVSQPVSQMQDPPLADYDKKYSHAPKSFEDEMDEIFGSLEAPETQSEPEPDLSSQKMAVAGLDSEKPITQDRFLDLLNQLYKPSASQRYKKSRSSKKKTKTRSSKKKKKKK